MGRVLTVYPDECGIVRSDMVKTKSSTVRRPVHKLCLIARHNINPPVEEADEEAIAQLEESTMKKMDWTDRLFNWYTVGYDGL